MLNREEVKLSSVLKLPTLTILVMLLEKGEARYSELGRLIRSRGTLSLSLKELDEEGLIARRVEIAKPIQSYYSLTRKGRLIATELRKLNELLSDRLPAQTRNNQ